MNHRSTQPETLLQLDADVGPAEPLTDEKRRALVAAVMGRTDIFQPASERRARMRRGSGYWAAGALLLAGAAAAAVAARSFSSSNPTATPAVFVVANAPQAVDQAPALPPLAEPGRAPIAAAEQPPAAYSESTRTEPLRKREPTQDAKGSVAALPPAVERVARDRLEQANRLRREQRYAEALNVYLQVAADYPQSLQAQAARVAAADIKLEHLRDAAGAQTLYNAANKQGGALSEEAAFGLAQSHRQTGDTQREREALERFLAVFPQSPSAPNARQRLQVLRDP